MAFPKDADRSPAVRYAELPEHGCLRELKRRKIAFHREPPTYGVAIPVRLDGKLEGIAFRGPGPDKKRSESPYEIMDCRLVLALDDFTKILRSHGVVEVLHMSVYRPPAGAKEATAKMRAEAARTSVGSAEKRAPGARDSKQPAFLGGDAHGPEPGSTGGGASGAGREHGPGAPMLDPKRAAKKAKGKKGAFAKKKPAKPTKKPSKQAAPAKGSKHPRRSHRSKPRHKKLRDEPGKRHGGALAIDVGTFVLADGRKVRVERDFHGRIGARTCGTGTGPTRKTDEAVALREIVCEAADARLFNVELTPDYNHAHYNHLHLEVTPGVKWFLVH